MSLEVSICQDAHVLVSVCKPRGHPSWSHVASDFAVVSLGETISIQLVQYKVSDISLYTDHTHPHVPRGKVCLFEGMEAQVGIAPPNVEILLAGAHDAAAVVFWEHRGRSEEASCASVRRFLWWMAKFQLRDCLSVHRALGLLLLQRDI